MTTKEKQQETKLAVVRPTQSTLEPLPMAAVDYNDPKVIEAIKAEICPPGTTETEFRLFIDKCRQSGLNPLLGECFCVPRWSNVKTGPDTYSLVKKNQFQAAEAGMASRAEKVEGYRGIRFGMIHEMDTCEINTGTSEVKHSYNLTGDRGKPLAAWAQVVREGFFFSPEIVYLADFEQRIKGTGKRAGELTEMWTKPAIMLPKCARAAAFRRAFPTPFSGVYAREELRDDDTRADLDAGSETVTVDARPTTEKLAERARAAKALPAESASKAIVEVVAEKPKVEAPADTKPAVHNVLETVEKVTPKADEKKAAAVPEGPTMVFDLPNRKTKGELIAKLSGPELLEGITWGESKIGGLKTDEKSTAEQKASKVRACIDAIKAEQAKREKALLDDAPEPGSDLDVD